MRRHAINFSVCCLLLAQHAFGTDRYYSDITHYSSTTRYRVSAESPDNQLPEVPAFQDKFVYELADTESGALLWKRNQRMEEPDRGDEYSFPEEGSPVDIFVSDDAWTVIRTGWNELVFVDPKGVDRGTISILEQALTKAEEEHLVWTTAGPMWSSGSIWHFLRHDGKRLFVIRPSWGRHLVFDVEAGAIVPATESILNDAKSFERQLVIESLNRGGKQQDDCSQLLGIGEAVWLAGEFGLRESIPILRRMEESDEFTSLKRGFGSDDPNSSDVDPHNYSTRGLRLIARHTLRRLGQIPCPLPVFEFGFRNRAMKPFPSPVPTVPRHHNADQIKIGLLAKDVLNLIGSPDGIDDTWSYNMDAEEPYCLKLTWDERSVIKVEKTPLPDDKHPQR